MYKTLPSSLRRKPHEGGSFLNVPSTPAENSNPTPNLVFGIHLNISSFISGGVQSLVGAFRKRTPTSSPSSSLSEAPTSSKTSTSPDPSPLLRKLSEGESYELIEIQTTEKGEGHKFSDVSTFNPTWCDVCGQLIWGLYDTGGIQCSLCAIIVHEKCQEFIRVDCRYVVGRVEDVESVDTLKGIPDLVDEDTLLDPESLEIAVNRYNETFPTGQATTISAGIKTIGYIRVFMNLRRPINVIAGVRPPSIYSVEDSLDTRKTLTSFYLPPDTVKLVYLYSDSTTSDVIRCLLAKFKVADSPHKYALYERQSPEANPDDNKTFSRIKMRRLVEGERPLSLALFWAFNGLSRGLVLQENDPGEVSWDSFSLPELKNFLVILDREEASHKKKIHDKYDALRTNLETILQETKSSSNSDIP